MAGTVEEIMTREPRTVEIGNSLVDAAREMREGDIGVLSLGDVAEDRDAGPLLAHISAVSPHH
jgi:predicted transcriptional regulator